MKRKPEKLSLRKMGLSDSETFKFLSSVRKNNYRLNCEIYRIILDCGYEEKEENYPTVLFCPKPEREVVGFQKDLKLLGKCEHTVKKQLFS